MRSLTHWSHDFRTRKLLHDRGSARNMTVVTMRAYYRKRLWAQVSRRWIPPPYVLLFPRIPSIYMVFRALIQRLSCVFRNL